MQTLIDEAFKPLHLLAQQHKPKARRLTVGRKVTLPPTGIGNALLGFI